MSDAHDRIEDDEEDGDVNSSFNEKLPFDVADSVEKLMDDEKNNYVLSSLRLIWYNYKDLFLNGRVKQSLIKINRSWKVKKWLDMLWWI